MAPPMIKFLTLILPLLFISTSYSESLEIEHQHGNRKHKHALPKEGLNHHHNKKTSTNYITNGPNSPIVTNTNGNVVINYGLIINGRIEKSKYSAEYRGYITGAFKVYKSDMDLANQFILKASELDNSKVLTMYMASIISSYWGKKLIKPNLVLKSFIQASVVIGLLEKSKEDNQLLSLAYMSRGTFNELMNDYVSALDDYKRSCVVDTNNCDVYNELKIRYINNGLI